MRHRFLFLNANGVEVKVRSVDQLAELFQAGQLTEGTLLFDVVTREWAPARTHPACGFMLEDGEPGDRADSVPLTSADESQAAVESEGSEEPESAAEVLARPETEGSQASPDEDAAPDTEEILGNLELIADDEHDMVDSFLQRRERERDEERMSGAVPDTGLEQIRATVDPSGYAGESVTDPGEETAYGTSEARGSYASRDGAARSSESGSRNAGGRNAFGVPTGGAAESGDRERDQAPPARGTSAASGPGVHALRQVALLTLLLGIGGWGIADAWSAPLPPPSAAETAIPRPPPRPPGPLAMTAVSLVPEDALSQMATSMDELRASMGLNEPPAVWMAGPYLANATSYPEIERYWERYRSFVQRLREEEQEFYRAGLERQLESQGVYGSAQEIRVARVMQDFRSDAPRRRAHYSEMDALADAALKLHEFLIQNSSGIRYEPVERGVTRDPILEVEVRNPRVRAALGDRVDLLLEALDAVAGPDPERRRDVTRHVLGRIGAGFAATAD